MSSFCFFCCCPLLVLLMISLSATALETLPPPSAASFQVDDLNDRLDILETENAVTPRERWDANMAVAILRNFIGISMTLIVTMIVK